MNAPHDPPTFASRGALAGRNGAQLFFCFAGSALLNVVSPSFFARVTPQGKDAWLAATLLAGTVASAAGVSLARRYGWGLGRRPKGLGEVGGCCPRHHGILIQLGEPHESAAVRGC